MKADLEKAAILAGARFPQLAPVIYLLKFIPDSRVDTMGVNESCQVLYNPEYLEDPHVCAPNNLIDLVMHETLHVFLNYFGRRGDRDHIRFNIAHDLEISTHVSPYNCLVPEQFNLARCKSAEFYYENLTEPIRMRCLPSGCSVHQVATGEPLESWGPVHKALVESAQKIMESSINGTLPGALSGLEKHAIYILNPTKPDARLKKLQTGMLVGGSTTYSYTRPSWRWGSPTIIMPGRAKYKPTTLIVLDVSGSMTGYLSIAAKIIMSAVQTIGAAVDVMAWDVKPKMQIKVRSAQDVSKLFGSGGGTDMRAALLYTKKLPKHDNILLVTDCDTPWPTRTECATLAPIRVLSVTSNCPPEYIPYIPMGNS